MPDYNIFISHSWAYGDAYEKLTNMLKSKPHFSYKDYSVPKDDPIHTNGSDQQLAEAIKNKIQPTQVVVIMAGKYATYSKWINEEIKIAQSGFSVPTPILAVTPWGAEQISSVVRDAADKIVGWNTDTIVSGIRELAK